MSRMTFPILAEMLNRRGLQISTHMPWFWLQDEIESDPQRVFRVLFGKKWKFEWDRAIEQTRANQWNQNDPMFAFCMVTRYVRDRCYESSNLTKPKRS